MPYTISTQNGSRLSREHNIRNPNVVRWENHIDPSGHYEIWKDEKIRDAYHRIFDKAVEEYNQKQKRKCRRIEDYYTNIKNHKTKHLAYELIIAIGSKKEPVNPEIGKEIMRKYVDTWDCRNANLEIIGAYYHADEQGVPHVHIDYIPVAEDYEKGMNIQNGIARALEQMGFVGNGKETSQIRWQKTENEALESICKDRGLEIYHPNVEGRVHLDTETYKAKMVLDETLERVKELGSVINEKQTEVENLTEKIKNLQGVHDIEVNTQEQLLGKNIFGRQKKKVSIEYEKLKELEFAAEEAKRMKANEDNVLQRERYVNYRIKELEEKEKILESEIERFKEKENKLDDYINEMVELKFNKQYRKDKKEMEALKSFVKGCKFDNGKNILECFEKEQKREREEDECYRK